jgi:hypothetical protein
MWEATVCHVLRRAALEVDRKEVDKRVVNEETPAPIRGALKPSPEEATRCLVKKNILGMNDSDRRRDTFVNRGSSNTTRGNMSELKPLIQQIVGPLTELLLTKPHYTQNIEVPRIARCSRASAADQGCVVC